MAVAVVFATVAAAIGVMPIGRSHFTEVPATVAAFGAATFLAQILTAFLLYNQYRATHFRPLAVLTIAYAGSAVILVEYLLSFPGLFSSRGWFGASAQTAPWLYAAGHTFFIVYVALYAIWEWLASRSESLRGTGIATLTAAAVTIVVLLPPFVVHFEGLWPQANEGAVSEGWRTAVVPILLGAHVVAIGLLLHITRLRYSVHVWLCVVVVVSAFDVLLTTVLGGTRYTAAWYLGRLEWAIAATSFLAVLLSNVYRILLALSANNTLLHAQTVSDELTGLLNRRGFNVRLEEEIRRLQRKGEPLSVLIVDVDDFKRYNDTFGHPAGDAALRAVARIILSTLRRSPDCACRIGGEEFAIVLPESDEPGAIAVGERVRRGVERLGILQGKGASHAALTVSVGVASTEDRPGADAEALTRAADRALYEAKESGRNCVRLATTAKRSLHAVASGLGVGTF